MPHVGPFYADSKTRTNFETPGLLMAGAAWRGARCSAGPSRSDAQVYGIAAGIVAAAVVGDLTRLNGAGVTALVAVGGTALAAVVRALGNWLLSEPVAETQTSLMGHLIRVRRRRLVETSVRPQSLLGLKA
jgi:hypothetical protein